MRASHTFSTQKTSLPAPRLARQARQSLFTATILGLGLWLGGAQNLHAQALQGPLPPEPMPTFELDKKGQKALLNFGFNFHPISDAKLKFSQFANSKLLVFYFSAKCGHCQHAAPYVQKLADELATKGFKSIAIAVKFNTEDDIRGFIRDFKIHMPVFHDDTREFGENYGTGSIPLIVVANQKGEYLRWKSFDPEQTPRQVLAEANLFAQK
jgi:thiol-disulfide isomerase/thioredoxin